MKYQLVCSDIDGTLLNKDRELSELTIAQIQRIAPVPFVLISSRMPKAMLHLQQQFTTNLMPIIAYNGGLILHGDTVLQSTCIDNKVLAAVITVCLNTKIHLSLFFADEWYVQEMDEWAKREINNTKVTPKLKSYNEVLATWQKENKGAHKFMCMGNVTEIDALYKTLEINFSDEIMLYRSKETYIEISHKSISKKTAIDVLLTTIYPNITLKDVIAFGDNYNDIEMLKAVGMGVAVANANTEVLSIATKVTDTNKNDGVAKALQLLF